MYSRDVPRIQQYVQDKGPDGLLDVATFVLATIQNALSRVKGEVSDIKMKGVASKALWGSKRGGYEYVDNNKQSLFNSLVEKPMGIDAALALTLDTPGMGLPKASFMLQCLGYNVGCLDSHNLTRFNVPISATQIGKVSDKTKMIKVDKYISLTRKLGGSEELWNSWCIYVAGNRANKTLPTGDMVSAYHYEAISGRSNP